MTSKSNDKEDPITPKEVCTFLSHKIANVQRETELRVQELVEIMKDCALGKITPDQAIERDMVHTDKWGEPLHGASASNRTTNEDIIAKMEELAQDYENVRQGKFTSRVSQKGAKNIEK